MRTEFLNNPIKRKVQELLFKDVEARTCLGLAGPNPNEYASILCRKAHYVVLCDINPVNNDVIHNSLIGTYNMYKPYSHFPINWIDADFCGSIINYGDDLLYLNNKLKRTHLKKYYLSFTFSVRDAGIENTLNWLRKNIYNFGLTSPTYINISKTKKAQYCKWLLCDNNVKLIQYKDSGDHMLSGLITITKN